MKSLNGIQVLRTVSVIGLAAVLWGFASVPAAAAEDAPVVPESETSYELSIDPTVPESTYSFGTPVLYSYGPEAAGNSLQSGGQEACISLLPRTVSGDRYRITRISAVPLTDNVTADADLRDGTAYGGKNPPVLSLKASNNVLDCTPEEYAVQLTITVGEISFPGVSNRRDLTLVIRGKTAFSRCRPLSGSTQRVSPQEGAVFSPGTVPAQSALVECTDYASVEFYGRAPKGLVNLLARTDASEVLGRHADPDMRVVDFVSGQLLSSPVRIRIAGPEDALLYKYHRESGIFTPISTSYEDGMHVFTSTVLSCYVLSPDAL